MYFCGRIWTTEENFDWLQPHKKMLKQIFLFLVPFAIRIFQPQKIKNIKGIICLIYLRPDQFQKDTRIKLPIRFPMRLSIIFWLMTKIQRWLAKLSYHSQVVLAGEAKSEAYLDVQHIARDVINKNWIHEKWIYV